MVEGPTRPADAGQITAEAAFWCMRLHDETCSDEDRQAFSRWLARDPEHAAEYQAMLEIWTVSGSLARHDALQEEVPVPARSAWVRRTLASAASLAMAVVLGWGFGMVPDTYHSYHSDQELREVTLADGSQVKLNRGTSLIYLGFRQRRQVRLSEGEAFFDVRHDPTQPFVVQAGDGRVVVTGTEFNVWKYEDQVVVTVLEGSVRVSSGSGHGHSDAADLVPGHQARYGGEHAALEMSIVDPEQAIAWREGKLIIDNLRLADALPLINRYLETPALLANTATGELRIGGIFNTNDMPGLLMQLPKVLPVRVEQTAEGALVIKQRDTRR